MKFMYVVPVLAISAALGVTSASRHLEPAQPAQPLAAPITPPWLSAPQDEDDGDPHAGLYAAMPDAEDDADDDAPGACTYDPNEPTTCDDCEDVEAAGGELRDGDAHAGLYVDDDPDAPSYAGDDPHAGLAAGGVDPDVTETARALAPVERSNARNGKTVAEVFAARSTLDQTQVAVRGTVVKLTEGVLGKTYLHLRDGTGTAEAGDDDLTVTTTEPFALGETVEVEGRLAIDQDVGVGYSYPALLADASRVQR